MNQQILEYYENKFESIISYLNTADVRKSLEDLRTEILNDTSSLKVQEDIEHNLEFINEFYENGIEVLNEQENIINETVKGVVEYITNLNKDAIINSIISQLEGSIKKWTLNENYTSFNGLFFYFSDGPYYSGIAYRDEKFEVILDDKKSLDFDDGNQASDYSIDFQLAEAMQIPGIDEYEEFAWEFEYELEIFIKIKELKECLVAICLHEALKHFKITQLLALKGFQNNGVVYLNEHEMRAQTVYVNSLS